MKAKKIVMTFESDSFTNYERISFLRERESDGFDCVSENITQDGETVFAFKPTEVSNEQSN